jgi:hypothetical protein
MGLHIWPDESDFTPRQTNWWVMPTDPNGEISSFPPVESADHVIERISESFPVFAVARAVRTVVLRVVVGGRQSEV